VDVLHLGQDDLPVECARSLLGDQILSGFDRLRPLFRGTLRYWRPGLS
jgi:hypothetical protein